MGDDAVMRYVGDGPDCVEEVAEWVFARLSISESVRVVWPEWDLVAESFVHGTRGFALRQVDWWCFVKVSDFDWAPETYVEDEIGDEYAEWTELTGEARHQQLREAAQSAVVAPSLAEIPDALHRAHVEHLARLRHYPFPVSEALCMVLAAVLDSGIPEARAAEECATNGSRLPLLSGMLAEVRADMLSARRLPVYPWWRHPRPEDRVEWFQYSERGQWSEGRRDYRDWGDPFPVDPSDLSLARKYRAAADADDEAVAAERPDRRHAMTTPRRIERVLRQEI